MEEKHEYQPKTATECNLRKNNIFHIIAFVKKKKNNLSDRKSYDEKSCERVCLFTLDTFFVREDIKVSIIK